MREIKLRPYQDEAIEDLRQGARERHKNQLLVAPTGAGKCLGIDTPVIMADGSIKMVQDVVPGDRLLGPDGGPRNVLSVARGREAMYLVTPIRGTPYRCNASHLLSLKTTTAKCGFNLADGSNIPAHQKDVVTTADCLYKSSKTAKHMLKGWRAPLIASFPDRIQTELPIPPYILGAWLGDGSRRTAAVSKPRCGMVDAWIAYGESLGLYCRRSDAKSCPTWHLTAGVKGVNNPVMDALRSVGLGMEKFIPDVYKYADHGVRAAVVAGLLDSDGYHSHAGFDWISKDERLAKDFAFVCQSLGLSANIRQERKGIKSTGFSALYWRVSISGDCTFLPLLDKIPDANTQKKRGLVHGITLTPEPEDDYYGFEIDGDRLFLLGDFTVTHNTVISTQLIDHAINKGSRVGFLVDRTQLVLQTSAMLDSYGIDHGVMQANHWRMRPNMPVQVCSAQTLERRGFPDDWSLVLVDECHAVRRSTADFIKNTSAKVVGLTATPFTDGLAQLYTRLSSVTTTNKLIEDGFLTPLRVYASVEADMKGAKIVAGEYAPAEIEARGSKIIGDIVTNWVAKTNEHFNGPVKTIVFSATVAHGNEICKQFNAAGYRFEQISYETDPEERAELIAEFSKPNSSIIGLCSVDALARGFDVPDVACGICARPLRKSFSTHIQVIGRVMRVAPFGAKKERGYALWLDHTGNYLKFAKDLDQLFEFGVKDLSDTEKDKEVRKDVEQKERKDIICSCGMVLLPSMKVCPACGKERKSKSLIEVSPGHMVEVGQQRPLLPNGKKMAVWMQNKPEVWAMLSTKVRDVAARKGLGPEDPYVMRMMKAKWHTWYGEWPNFAFPTKHDAIPCQNFNGRWVRDQIAFAKKRAA